MIEVKDNRQLLLYLHITPLTTIIIPPTTIPLNQLTTIVDKIEPSTISIKEKIINNK